jgi:pimeloyl-ACP methyl ester carboxylesterase
VADGAFENGVAGVVDRGSAGMSRAGILGAALGVVATGTAIGIAVERYTIGRAVRRMAEVHDPGEVFGTLRGTPQTVMASDGVELYVEVDDPYTGPRSVDWTGLTQGGQRRGRSSGRRGVADADQRPTLLFTHGFCLSQDCWHFQRSAFSGSHRMVFWDQRGHGRSDRLKAGHDLSVDVLGEDLYAVLEATCPSGPVILVGHSMGGMTMMALAEAHPELFGDRVVGVALLATSAGDFGRLAFGLPKAGARLFHLAVPGVISALARQRALVERGRRAGGDLGLVLTKRYAFGPDVPESVVRFTQDLIQSTPIDVIADYFPLFGTLDKTAAVPIFDRVPTLVLVGDRDLLLPPEHSKALADAIPSAELTVVPGAGHVVILERPEVVDTALRRLVDRVETSHADPADPAGPPVRKAAQ